MNAVRSIMAHLVETAINPILAFWGLEATIKVTLPPKVSLCGLCRQPGRWGFDDDWCHEDTDAAIKCPREGHHPAARTRGR